MGETPVSAMPDLPVLDDDAVLAYTQNTRRKIVQVLTKDTATMQDPKMANVLLSTLDGLDRQALGQKRIRVEEKANETMDGMSGLVAQMLRQASTPEFFKAPTDGSTRPAPVVEGELSDDDVVAGEMSQTPAQMSISEFQSKFARPGDAVDAE